MTKPKNKQIMNKKNVDKSKLLMSKENINKSKSKKDEEFVDNKLKIEENILEESSKLIKIYSVFNKLILKLYDFSSFSDRLVIIFMMIFSFILLLFSLYNPLLMITFHIVNSTFFIILTIKIIYLIKQGRELNKYDREYNIWMNK